MSNNILLNERLLDVKEAIKFLKISRGTLAKYFEAGLERAVVGERVYTSIEAIQRFSEKSEEFYRQRSEQRKQRMRAQWKKRKSDT